MELDKVYFKKGLYYNNKQVEYYINIIQTSDNDKRVSAFSNLVFHMMKDIVNKNIANYIKLMHSIKEEINKDEMISECYIIFDTCIHKYKCYTGYNFYFYFNKSLSRSFFRLYTKAMKRINHITIMDDMSSLIHFELDVKDNVGSIELLLETMNLTGLERRICESKIYQQKSVEFLKLNTDVTEDEYLTTIKQLKNRFKKAKINNDL